MRELDREMRVQIGFQPLPCAVLVADLLAEGADGYQPLAHASPACGPGHRPHRISGVSRLLHRGPSLRGRALQGSPQHLLPSRRNPLSLWSHAPRAPGGRELAMIACHLIKSLLQPLPIGVTELRCIALLKLLQSLNGLRDGEEVGGTSGDKA